jgi:ABC-type bacteriocin/lantibiotic exporter with double-glycine peptidase domain
MFQIATIPYAQPLLDAVPEKPSAKTPAGRLSGDIEVSQLSFRYGPDREPVLSNVSFSVAPGEFVAIVGPSGSGKSTLVKLLLGFEQPALGAVLYDRQDLKNLEPDSVRRQIGAVLQRPQLMPTTLFENVRGISNASVEDVWAALELAGLKADVEAMPMGLHTLVAEGASGFSGGQLQRMAIARAVVRKPAILILDEATSALDNAMEREVSENLSRLAITRIVIAHRLSTVRRADRIIMLTDGRIAETGTFDELVARGGAFAQLARHTTPF